jgi:hypothetical protein
VLKFECERVGIVVLDASLKLDEEPDAAQQELLVLWMVRQRTCDDSKRRSLCDGPPDRGVSTWHTTASSPTRNSNSSARG